MASLLEESLNDIIARTQSREIKWFKVADNAYRWEREDLAENTKVTTTIQLRRNTSSSSLIPRSSFRLVFTGVVEGKSFNTVIDDSDPVVMPLLSGIFNAAKDVARDDIGSFVANITGFKKT